MKRHYTVAFCDIFGFKGLVKTTPLEEVVATIEYMHSCLNFSVHQDEFSASPQAPVDSSDVGLSLFSDSIFLYTKRDEPDCIQQLLSAIGWLLFQSAMSQTPLLRCGVAYGPGFIDSSRSIFVGPAIVEAVESEAAQDWFGGALTAGAVERVQQCGDIEDFEWWVRPYRVPEKSGRERDTLAIDWTRGGHDREAFRPEGIFLPSPATILTDSQKASLDRKRQNTIRFHKQVCQKC